VIKLIIGIGEYMKIHKKILALIIAAAMILIILFFIAACGEKDNIAN